MPIELTVGRGVRDEPTMRLHADLTNADLILENVAWRKPPGRSATLQCDIAKGKTHKTELQNFKVAGDDIAIEGWAAIDADNRLREFYFPDFSLNVITRMEVQGALDKNDVWKVKARGPTFDGRDFFRSLFSLGQLAEKAPKPKKPREGVDLDAEIGTVIGHSEVSLAQPQAQARQARREADGPRRARHARRRQAARRRAEAGSGTAAQVASRFHRRRSGIQADRLLPEHSGRTRAPRGQPRRQGRGREDRHSVGR